MDHVYLYVANPQTPISANRFLSASILPLLREVDQPMGKCGYWGVSGRCSVEHTFLSM